MEGGKGRRKGGLTEHVDQVREHIQNVQIAHKHHTYFLSDTGRRDRAICLTRSTPLHDSRRHCHHSLVVIWCSMHYVLTLGAGFAYMLWLYNMQQEHHTTHKEPSSRRQHTSHTHTHTHACTHTRTAV